MGRRQPPRRTSRLRPGPRRHNLSYVKGRTGISTTIRRPLGAMLAAAAASAALAAGAQAAPASCPGTGATSLVVRDGGPLESIAVDATGRLIYDDLLSGAVRVLANPSARPRTLTRLTAPGGIVVAPTAPTVAGSGSSPAPLIIAQGNTIGPLIGGASLIAIDPATGARQRLASRLLGGNGLARSTDGTLYTSDVAAGVIDRIGADGAVTRGWWRSSGGPNGLAVSPDGRTLYANLSTAAAVVAIDVVTGRSRILARVENPAATPDGLAIDAAGRLYVTLYLAGEVRRIDPTAGTMCTLARGLRLPTAVAIAPPGGPFAPTSAYVTTYGGVRAIAGAVPAT